MIDLVPISIMRCSRSFVFLVQQSAHMTTVRCDPVNPPLLGMTQVMSDEIDPTDRILKYERLFARKMLSHM